MGRCGVTNCVALYWHLKILMESASLPSPSIALSGAPAPVWALIAFPTERGQAETLAAIFDQCQVAQPQRICCTEVLGKRDAECHPKQGELLVGAERREQ